MLPPSSFKTLVWVGPSRRELKALPRDVQRAMGIALWQAQLGNRDPAARPMRGGHLREAIEIRDDFDRRTFRVMYTASFDEAVYVLCAFQKKATHGIKTPSHILALVERRLRVARAIHALGRR